MKGTTDHMHMDWNHRRNSLPGHTGRRLDAESRQRQTFFLCGRTEGSGFSFE